jgi:hypothetical protein
MAAAAPDRFALPIGEKPSPIAGRTPEAAAR